MPPSTRETIDLTFDDETETNVNKKDPSNLPDLIPNNSNPPRSVTIRQRQKNEELKDDTPFRPPSKRHKYPPGSIAQSKPPASPKSLKRRPPSPRRDSFNHIPDSEGEDEDLCYGEEFRSDDIPVDTKDVQSGAPAEIITQIQPTAVEDGEENVVPESPLKLGKELIHEMDEPIVQPFKPYSYLLSDNLSTAPAVSKTGPSASNLTVVQVIPRALGSEGIISNNVPKDSTISKVRPSWSSLTYRYRP